MRYLLPVFLTIVAVACSLPRIDWFGGSDCDVSAAKKTNSLSWRCQRLAVKFFCIQAPATSLQPRLSHSFCMTQILRENYPSTIENLYSNPCSLTHSSVSAFAVDSESQNIVVPGLTPEHRAPNCTVRACAKIGNMVATGSHECAGDRKSWTVQEVDIQEFDHHFLMHHSYSGHSFSQSS